MIIAIKSLSIQMITVYYPIFHFQDSKEYFGAQTSQFRPTYENDFQLSLIYFNISIIAQFIMRVNIF